MDGALAAQQLTCMAAEYSLPLLLLKLGIAAAFDSVEHPALGSCARASSLDPTVAAKVHCTRCTQFHHAPARLQHLGPVIAQMPPARHPLLSWFVRKTALFHYFLKDAWEQWTNRFDAWQWIRVLVAVAYAELHQKLQDVQDVLRPLGFKLAAASL